MTTKELQHVKEILQRIKNLTPKVELAIAYVVKDLKLRDSQRDNFKAEYDYPGDW